VEQYEKAFHEIRRFLPDVNRDEQMKAWRFIGGLREEIPHVLAALDIHSYKEDVDRAKQIEVQLRETATQKSDGHGKKRFVLFTVEFPSQFLIRFHPLLVLSSLNFSFQGLSPLRINSNQV